jgi:hypothetical protein
MGLFDRRGRRGTSWSLHARRLAPRRRLDMRRRGLRPWWRGARRRWLDLRRLDRRRRGFGGRRGLRARRRPRARRRRGTRRRVANRRSCFGTSADFTGGGGRPLACLRVLHRSSASARLDEDDQESCCQRHARPTDRQPVSPISRPGWVYPWRWIFGYWTATVASSFSIDLVASSLAIQDGPQESGRARGRGPEAGLGAIDGPAAGCSCR